MTPEGVVYVLAFDAGRPDLVPETKGIVRANVPVGGWKIEPLEGDPRKSRTTYMAEVDLKGSIPGFVIKTANKDQGYQIVKLRSVVEKYIKDHPK